jgi:CDP-glycerol glycerophosphotransferase
MGTAFRLSNGRFPIEFPPARIRIADPSAAVVDRPRDPKRVDGGSMKFDRASPRDWVFFIVTALNILIASVIAFLTPRRNRSRCRGVMSGHVFNGNLRAFYDTAGRQAAGWEFRYIHIDHTAYKSRAADEIDAMSSLRLGDVIWMARADVVMTDHGPGIWTLLQLLRPRIAFVEVWHGVGFKGLGPDFGRKLARYRGFFAASQWDARDAFAPERGNRVSRMKAIHTGYAAVDPLARPESADPIAARYGLDPGRSGRVLIAPTWNHGDSGRSLFPFGLDAEEFLSRLDEWARAANWTVIFRAHLNAPAVTPGSFPNIRFMPLKEYPLTYELLAVSDVLVTDWSSIATDYLVSGRPTIFLDVPPPFPLAHLTADDRVGYRVSDWNGFVEALTVAAHRPEEYAEAFADDRERVLDKAFGATLDGHSADRYLEALNKIVDGTLT